MIPVSTIVSLMYHIYAFVKPFNKCVGFRRKDTQTQFCNYTITPPPPADNNATAYV